jgi:cell division transport system permease protein
MNSTRATPLVARVEFISKDSGLESLKRHEGLAEVIATLKANPLPDALTVHLKRAPPADVDRLATLLRAEAKVAHVQLDTIWLARLDRLLGAGRVAVGILALLLGLAFVAITFNTIRMQIVTRRDEIDVSRLVGATSATIRRPFYYMGGLTGLLGAAVAWAIAWGAVRALDQEVAGLAALYASEFRLAALNPMVVGAVFAGALALGLASAWLAVSKYLLESRPR